MNKIELTALWALLISFLIFESLILLISFFTLAYYLMFKYDI